MRREDSLDEVIGHCCLKAFAADEQINSAGGLREEQRCLSSRVAGTDDHNFFASAEAGFHGRGRIMDSLILEAAVAGHVQLLISGSGCDDDRACIYRSAVFEVKSVAFATPAHAEDLARYREPGAELLCLYQRSFGQLLSGDSRWKAKIVFDPGACAGLSSGGGAFDDDGGESLGGRVHCGRQSRWACADDRDVVDGGVIAKIGQSEFVRQLCVGRIAQDATVGQYSDRQLLWAEFEAVKQGVRVLIAFRIHHAEGISVACQKTLQPDGIGAVLMSDQENSSRGVANDVESAADAGLHDKVGDFDVGLHDLLEVRPADAQNVADSHCAAVE